MASAAALPVTGYEDRRARLETYFDRTAAATWERLTSDAPVSRIRATVRAGRDRMRDTLLSWLPADLTGLRVLDAGCGTGALAVEAARRGAEVVAVDIAANLVQVARERQPDDITIDWRVGDMLDPALGRFDHVVAMDSLIHYPGATIATIASKLAERSERSVLFTVAPATPMLRLMHGAGRLFPRADRAPAIVPVSPARIRQAIGATAREARVSGGFYISHAIEWVRP